MPRASSWPKTAPELIFVVDSGALFNMKRAGVVKVDEQWPMFSRMSEMVRTGEIAFPRHVANEMIRAQHPDTPGTWAAGSKDSILYPDPTDDAMAEVQSVAQLTDPAGEAEYEPADPYVVAMAFEIAERYPDGEVIVVSDDYVDRMPRKESVQTACDRLGLECRRSVDFAEHMRSVLGEG